MKLSYHWLKDYVALPADPQTVADLITQHVAEVEQVSDTIITIDNKTLTHRPDLFSHIGFARELSVLLNTPLKLPALKEYAGASASPYQVQIQATKQCRRYLGVVVDHVTVKPSPDWLQQRLRAIGLQPINNVVDVTNYVMYEYGQPLHAFDYNKLAGGEVHIRLAKKDEQLTTLDGVKHHLTETMLVIADQKKPVALAGIMGGKASEITDQTTTVAIESANFNPVTIRLGAQSLGLRSDASTRHEKNLPLVLAEQGLYRALELLEELAAGQVASRIIDERTTVETNPAISLDCSYGQRLIGVAIKPDKIKTILTKLGCQVSGTAVLKVIPPPHRTDLTIPEELIEEVARIYGYNAIPPQPLIGQLEPQPIEPTWQLAQQLIQKAIEAGCIEVYNYSFYKKELGHEYDIRLLNPMNPDQALLRGTLVLNLMITAERNIERGEHDFTLVEYGHIFKPEGEKKCIAVLCVGKNEEVYRQAKGYEQLFGYAGVISIFKVGQWYAAAWEIDLDECVHKPEPVVKFKPLPNFPGIELDISVEFPNETSWSDIESVIRKTGGSLLRDISLFDVYKNSLGIRFMLRSDERTLAMDEAEKIRDTIIQALQKNFNATHRF